MGKEVCNLVCLEQSKSLGVNLVFYYRMLATVRILQVPSMHLLELINSQVLFNF